MKNIPRVTLLIFGLAIAMRLFVFGADYAHVGYKLEPAIIGDDGYFQIATNLVVGNGFSDLYPPQYRPNPLRPPLYPFLIAGILKLFHSHWPVLAAQMLLGTCIPLLGYALARRFVDEKIARFVGIALALDPFLALLSVIYYTETVFTALLLGHFILFVDYIRKGGTRRLVWSAVFFALALLVKPTMQFLPPLIALLVWYLDRSRVPAKRRVVHVLMYPVLCLVFVTPWLYRNQVEFGTPSLGAQPAYNLAVYLVPTVLAIDNHTSFPAELHKLESAGLDENDITPRTSDAYKKSAIAILRQHPRALVISALDTGVAFFTHDGILTTLQHMGMAPIVELKHPALALLVTSPLTLLASIIPILASPLILILLFRAWWILITISFLYGIWRYFRAFGLHLAALYVILVVFYFTATTAINGLGVNARFRVPVDAVILTFAFYGLSCAASAILRKLRPPAHA